MLALRCRADDGVGVVVESGVLRLRRCGEGYGVGGGGDGWCFFSEVGSILVQIFVS
jgi:hypothetical protein